MLRMHPRVAMVNEPLIGLHLGLWTADVLETPLQEHLPTEKHVWHSYRGGHEEYFFAPSFRSAWAPPLREMMLARFGAHVDRYGKPAAKAGDPVVCIKEPMGAQATGFVLDVLPRARLLNLVRDPRDVVASLLDAYRSGTWYDKGFPGCNFAEVSRERRVRDFATRWRVRSEIAIEAFDSHDADRRLLVRYEDLRAEPAKWLSTIFSWVGVDEADVDEYVRRTAFERGSSEDRGEGQFRRKAAPGSWSETLTAGEVRIVDEECARPMARLGYSPASAGSRGPTAATA